MTCLNQYCYLIPHVNATQHGERDLFLMQQDNKRYMQKHDLTLRAYNTINLQLEYIYFTLY
jgi:hypothetical protein